MGGHCLENRKASLRSAGEVESTLGEIGAAPECVPRAGWGLANQSVVSL